MKLGVVTNCSEELGRRAAAQVGARFDFVATAEAAGAARTLFVAGSPDDIAGADRVGMPVYWHNRRGLDLGDRVEPLVEHESLAPLLGITGESGRR